MDDELARKKRELEELNEMIAYKKSLVDPRGLDPGQRTCIDYDHGRIAIPLAEYKPVRSILKKRPEGSELPHSSRPYDDPFYDRPYRRYSDHYGDGYGDPYARPSYDDPYGEHAYLDRRYDNVCYGKPVFEERSSASRGYTDRYDVYDEPYDDRYYDPEYGSQTHDRPYSPVKSSPSLESHGPSPSQPSQLPGESIQAHLTHSSTTASSQHAFRPPSPTEPPPRSPSPKLKHTTQRETTPAVKPPLDRFLDMLNKKVDAEKKSQPMYVNDDLLPHERALQDGKGFSRIVGLAQDPPSSILVENKQANVKLPVDGLGGDDEHKTEPYNKIQSLLRTIGLKLSTGDMSKLASRAQEKVFAQKSPSADRETGSGCIRSSSPANSSNMEPIRRQKVVSEYEAFLDQQELEILKKAQELQSQTKVIGSHSSDRSSPKPPPGPPPAHYQHPSPPVNWPLGAQTQIPPSHSPTNVGTEASLILCQSSQRFGVPPGPPPGPPPRHARPPPGPPPGPPPRGPPRQPFIPLSSDASLSCIGQPHATHTSSTSPPPPLSTAMVTPPSSTLSASTPSEVDQSTISTTVARCLKVIETVKSLAAQPASKHVKSVQFSLPSQSPSASTAHTSPEPEDIQTKEKVLKKLKMSLGHVSISKRSISKATKCLSVHNAARFV